MQKGLLYNMLLRLGKCFFLFPLFFIACDDLEDKPSIVPESNGDVFETGTAEMYILSEGLFNQNNSSLARYSFNRQRCTNNYFSANNQRGLGDTANDIAIYGNKIYVVVSVSSTVEVIDFPTGKSIRQIAFFPVTHFRRKRQFEHVDPAERQIKILTDRNPNRFALANRVIVFVAAFGCHRQHVVPFKQHRLQRAPIAI